jgi:hypothetical protein
MRSPPASPTSPATGGASNGAAAKAPRPRGGKVTVELQVERGRAVAWAIATLLLGGLMSWGFGTVGVWAGLALIGLGLFRAFQVAQTFRHPVGAIVVGDAEVVLPRGICMADPLRVPPADVTAVYFLRRAVPWNRSAPVLVVELGARALAYPRDWFASEADQRHAVHALIRSSPSLRGGATDDDDDDAASDGAKPGAAAVVAAVEAETPAERTTAADAPGDDVAS